MLHIYFLGKRRKPLEQQVRLLQDTDTVFKIIFSFFFFALSVSSFESLFHDISINRYWQYVYIFYRSINKIKISRNKFWGNFFLAFPCLPNPPFCVIVQDTIGNTRIELCDDSNENTITKARFVHGGLNSILKWYRSWLKCQKKTFGYVAP